MAARWTTCASSPARDLPRHAWSSRWRSSSALEEGSGGGGGPAAASSSSGDLEPHQPPSNLLPASSQTDEINPRGHTPAIVPVAVPRYGMGAGLEEPALHERPHLAPRSIVDPDLHAPGGAQGEINLRRQA